MIFNRDVWATVVFWETSRQDVNLNRNKNAPTLFVMKGVGAFLICFLMIRMRHSLYVQMCRCFFSSNISEMAKNMPDSSTLPNSSLMAVPNMRIVGERLI